jgi:hypothetical protein
MATVQPPTTPIEFAAGSVRKWSRHRVKVKRVWDATWIYVDHLEALNCTECVAPTVASASLVYHAGDVKREGSDVSLIYPLLNYNGWYVAIEMLSSDRPAGADEPGNDATTQTVQLWTGVILHNETSLGGGAAPASDEDDPNAIAPSDQSLTAYGLEALLDLTPIWGTLVVGAGEDDPGDASVIEKIIPFNARLAMGLEEIGNRSADKYEYDEDDNIVLASDATAPGTFYVFDGGPDAADWTLLDAVEYVVNALGPVEPVFSLAGQFADLDGTILPRFDLSGLSVKQALDEMINPRRGFGWCIRYPLPQPPGAGDEADQSAQGNPQVFIYSVTDVPVSFADQTLPANPQIVDLDLSGRIDVIGCTVTDDERTHFGRIVVRGEPLLVCGSFSLADQTLEKGWTASSETAYINATGDLPEEKDASRTTDELKPVYTLFRVPSDWDFYTGDGQGGQGGNANPAVDADGSIDLDSQAPVRRGWGLAFERNVPFFKPKYTADMKPDWRDALGFIFNPSINGSEGSWVYTDQVPANLRLLDNDLGVEVAADPPHRLGLNHATGIISGTEPQFDYEKLICTLAFRTDQRLRVIVDIEFPQGSDETADQYAARKLAMQSRQLTIEVPGAEAWIIAGGTVERVDAAGNLVYYGTGDGAILRNDVTKLRRVAVCARAWYGKQRNALDLSIRAPGFGPFVGTYIGILHETAGDQAINSILTHKTHDLQTNTTRLQTGYGELDFTQRSASSTLTARQERWNHR